MPCKLGCAAMDLYVGCPREEYAQARDLSIDSGRYV